MESNIVKTNEQKLRESEEKYRLIFENANDLFAVLNNKFEYEYINEKAYQKILGYSNEDILGKTHYDIINPEDYKISIKILRGGFKKGGETGELRLRHKNGKYIWVETKVSVFKNSDGLLKVITISRDLTDRVLSEKRLKESEEKYRLISEGSDDLILAYNERMEIEYVNAETHERILGYSAHLFWKQDFLFSIIHQDDRKILGSAIREGYKGGTYKLHIRYKHEKGHYIWFEFTGKTFHDKKGSKKSLVVGRDMTEIKLVQEQLQESEEKYRYFFNNAQVGLFWSRISDGKFLECNDTFAKLVGYDTREECVADYISLEHYMDLNTRNEMIEEIRINNEIKDFEIQVTKRDGTPFWASISVRINLKENRIEGAAIDITNRKQAEQELQRSEANYRDLYESAPNAYFSIKPDKSIILCNNVAVSLLGYNKEELLGMDVFKLYSNTPEGLSKAKELFREFLNGIPIKDEELQMKHKNGNDIWISLTVNSINNQKGQVVESRSMVIDISDRKKTEQKLKESEEKYRNIIQNAKEGYYEVDLKGNFTFFNKALRKLLKYSQNELYGMNYAQIMIEHSRNGTFKAFNEAYRNKKDISSLEYTLINKKGEIIYGLTSVNLRYNSEGNIIGFSGFMRDITEQKLVEQKLKESEYKYRHLFETSLYFIGLVNSEGNIIDCNNAMKDIHFIEDVIGKNFKEIFSLIGKNKPLIPIIEKALKNIFEGHTQEGFDFRLNRSVGGHLWIHIEFSLIEIENQKLIQFIMQDITERKRSEQLLQESIEELARINAELEQFTYVASHDLKEPLRMISSFAHLLEKRYKDKLDEDANDFIHFITDGVARMQDLIKNLLDYSKIGKLNRKFEEVNLNDVLKDVIDNLRQIITETKAEIIYDSLPSLFADRHELLQVFQNLISNALKFRGIDSPLIKISARPERKHWVFSIHDNGIGIDSKDFERIFIIFQRLHKTEQYEGTGLGLAICKKIVERQGGKMWVESEVGKGSAFYFSIPSEDEVRS